MPVKQKQGSLPAWRVIFTNSYVTDVINLNNENLKAVAHGTSFDNLEGPDLNMNKYIQIDPFTFGKPCSIEVYYNIHTYTTQGRIIDFGLGGKEIENV